MDCWLVFHRNTVILNEWTKRNGWSFNRFSKSSLIWSLPIRSEILYVSQIELAFHGMCPHIFIQTWLQQYDRGAFLCSAHCSFRNTISLRSVWCRRAMIPGKIFTSFAKFHGVVSVNDLKLPVRLQEVVQAPLCFLRSFGFARIRHWVVKFCTTIAYRWLCRDLQLSLRTLSAVIKSPKISARGTVPPMRLLHGALVILVLWQISQFRSLEEVSRTLCLPKSTLLVGSKDNPWENWCVSLCVQELQICSEFLQPFR